MPFTVVLTDDAARDLEDIHDYIADHDGPERAESWLAKVERILARLNHSPNRGSYPKELLTLGIREYRQVHFKPYRIVYRIVGKSIYVFLVSDGRRDMRALLERRLFEA